VRDALGARGSAASCTRASTAAPGRYALGRFQATRSCGWLAHSSAAADNAQDRLSLLVVFRGRGELIDHIIVSHALVQRVEQVDTGPGQPTSITENPTIRRDEPASDHVPVVAHLRLEDVLAAKRRARWPGFRLADCRAEP
jgi:hypothetical protein